MTLRLLETCATQRSLPRRIAGMALLAALACGWSIAGAVPSLATESGAGSTSASLARHDAAGPAETLTFVRSIALPGVEGRIDHFAWDPQHKRLFVAALGNNTIAVIDVESGTVAATIRDLKNPQGVAVAPDLGLLAVANARDGTCHIYRSDTLKQVGTVDLRDDADNARYDADAHAFWVGYGSGGLALIDPKKLERVADVPLPAHPESFQLEEHGKRIFVNVPDKKCIVVVDREKKAVLAQWPLTRAGANFPMALDEAGHRLLVGCRSPARLLVLDTTSGKEVAALNIVADCDDVFYDAVARRIYVSGGGGEVSVVAQKDADTYQEVGRVKTASGARTSFFDPVGGMLYVAVPHHLLGQEAEIRVFRAGAAEKR